MPCRYIDVSRLEKSTSGLRKCHDRPHFDRSIVPPGDFRCDFLGFGGIRRFNQVTTELFLGFGKRTVGGQVLSVPHAHGFCRSRWLERVAAPDRACELVAEGRECFGFSGLLGRMQLGPSGFPGRRSAKGIALACFSSSVRRTRIGKSTAGKFLGRMGERD